MEKALDWLSENKYQVHLTGFFVNDAISGGDVHSSPK